MARAADSEAMWIERVVIHDDHAAFAELVRLHQTPVRRFLRRLCGSDWSRADDLAQDTFLKAYRHIGGFRGEGCLLSWLFRIAWQVFISQQRKHRGVIHETWDEVHHGAALPAIDDASARIIDRLTLEQLLCVLRSEERAAIVLHYQQELTHPEVADVLGLPLGTVKTLIRRARQKMQQAFEATSTVETA